MKTLTIRDQNGPVYDIVFSTGFEELLEAAGPLNLKNRKVCIVSETRVAGLYMKTLKDILAPAAREVIDFVFPEGEASKTLATVQELYERLILAHFDRKDLLVALGGGVVGDLTGYAAATYLRGIDFIQIPTSLLAQVDSSIGGKTGVDFNAYKNMVGAFHQPKLVYMNFSALKTLSERQFRSGMGEIIKHGLIKDMAYYEWMKAQREAILARDPEVLSQLVYKSCQIKGQVVEHDPKEQGERALLNFGHTLGHAIEKLEDFSLLHGECVALGVVGAARISCLRGGIDEAMFEDICQTIASFGLPTALPGNSGDARKASPTAGASAPTPKGGAALTANDAPALPLTTEAVVAATKLDKKMEAGAIKFILLAPAGCGIIDKTVTDEELAAGARAVGTIG